MVRMGLDLGDWVRKSLLGKRHIYPRHGFASLYREIVKQARAEGVIIQSGTQVVDLQFTAPKAPVVAILQDTQGAGIHSVTSKIVVLPTRGNLPKITLGENIHAHTTNANLLQFRQFILLIRTDRPSTYSYLQIVNHPLLRRAHNITPELQAAGHLSLGYELHIVNLETGLSSSKDVSGADVLLAMQGLGKIPNAASLTKHAHNLREMPVPDREQMRKIKVFAKSSVFVLWTRDLSRAFGMHRLRWQEKITPFDPLGEKLDPANRREQ
jgi:hypothetical protein